MTDKTKKRLKDIAERLMFSIMAGESPKKRRRLRREYLDLLERLPPQDQKKAIQMYKLEIRKLVKSS